MRCPICGLKSADDFHIAEHTLSDRRIREGVLPAPSGENWRPIPTAPELIMIAGYAIENDMIRSVNRRWVKEE